MKHFFVTVELWVRLILSIVSAESEHCQERNQRVRWWRLARRIWKVRSLLGRIVRGDTTYIVHENGMDWESYLDYSEDNNFETITLLDVVVTSKPNGWYYSYVAWGREKLPAPWVNKFYNL